MKYDLVVIGAGPGGEVGAIRASQLGMKVAVVEKNEHLGGTCLNVGCIPTKALLESAKTWTKLQHATSVGFSLSKLEYKWDEIMGRKEGIVDAQRKGLRFLMKKNKIDVHHGHGRFKSPTEIEVTGPDGKITTLATAKTLIATGSRVKQLPFAKSDGKNILTSDDILFIDQVPKSLAVIGGGVVGVEFASLFGRFGTEVEVIEMLPQVLPFEDAEAVKELTRHIAKQNVTFTTGKKLESIKAKAKGCEVTIAGEKPKTFDKVLVSIGREPVTDDLGLAALKITPDRGFVPVDSHYQTSVSTVFAIGDAINTPALAHTASAEAIHAVEIMAGKTPPIIDYAANPSAVYSYPEIASIGATEDTLKAQGTPYKATKFPFAPLAKAKIEDATEGFIKVLTHPEFGELLGVHIIGARATELISEFALGKVLETTIDEIGHTIHPHPTISETVMEAAHAAMHGAIHL